MVHGAWCRYFPPACPSVWDSLVFLVTSRCLLPHNFALCLRFLLQLTHVNTPHQAVRGMAQAIMEIAPPATRSLSPARRASVGGGE